MRQNKPFVAIICARNPGNAGMYSVDLAALDFFSRLDCDFDFLTSHTPQRMGRRTLNKFFGIDVGHKNHFRFGKIKFYKFSGVAQLSKYSHIVYWGDFINNPAYGRDDFSRTDLNNNMSKDIESAFARWQKLYNLSEGKPSGRVISVGNNFQYPTERFNAEDKAIFKNMEKNFDMIFPRDYISFENLLTMFSSESVNKVHLGMDAAFLLTYTEIPTKENIFCYHFRRSRFGSSIKLVNEIESITKLKGISLGNWTNLSKDHADTTFWKYLRLISASQFVITDLYHVAINAIRQNIPVFGIGNISNAQVTTLSDFKKDILFKTFDLHNYYIKIGIEEAREDKGIDDILSVITKLFPLDQNTLNQIFKEKNRKIIDFKRQLTECFEINSKL